MFFNVTTVQQKHTIIVPCALKIHDQIVLRGKGLQVHLYGSTSMFLSGESSDLDICVLKSDQNKHVNNDNVSIVNLVRLGRH